MSSSAIRQRDVDAPGLDPLSMDCLRSWQGADTRENVG